MILIKANIKTRFELNYDTITKIVQSIRNCEFKNKKVVFRNDMNKKGRHDKYRTPKKKIKNLSCK